MRRKPYTVKGLSRVPCFKCGTPSTQQWQICSLGNEYKGVCTECDLELNKLVLKFFGFCKDSIMTLSEQYAKYLTKNNAGKHSGMQR